MTPKATPSRSRAPWILLSYLIIARLVLLIFAPHDDPSEARYAEIARKMVETGDWITPQHDYGVPFWAKPPLSTWMSALGMELFGIHEFGSRILIFAAALGILLLVGRFASREWSAKSGISAAAILMAMPLFFYCSAAVMTDLALLLGITLSMIAFITAIRTRSLAWGYAFFAGLAIGILAKGPLTGVLVGAPVFLWILATRQVRDAWRAIPWLTGTVGLIAITLPWYLAAELKTPGFLDYFIIGEHWNRFFKTGWTGDLYGKAHAQAPGTIWLYLLLGTFPLCFAFLALPFRSWKRLGTWLLQDRGIGLYLVLWSAWPALFFTPARNVIATYPLPALPAVALLLVLAGHRSPGLRFRATHPAFIAPAVLLIALYTGVTLFFPGISPKHSERDLVRTYDLHRSPGDRLVYFGQRRYSAEFYSAGQAKNTRSPGTIATLMAAPGTLYVAASPKSHAKLPSEIRRQLQPLATFGPRSSLYREMLPGNGNERFEASSH